jgi:hypothetical protein
VSNKRDYKAAERYWSPNYIQHSAHIEPGREGLFNLVRNAPSALKYEPGPIVADGDYVIVHGRFSGFGLAVNWIAVDILHIEDGILELIPKYFEPEVLTAVVGGREINYDFTDELYADFQRDVSKGISEGRIKYREDIVDDLENVPEAFITFARSPAPTRLGRPSRASCSRAK